jgi:DNA repair exonuclease SbcCD ATPase subunit
MRSGVVFVPDMTELSSLQDGGGRRGRGATRAPLLAAPVIRKLSLAEERARLDADLAELRETEANLRVLEKRLRAMQAEIDAAKPKPQSTQPPKAPARAKTGTRGPFPGDAGALHAEWDKLIRARELLESEQAHLRGDRIALRDETAVVRRRAQAVAEREAKVAEREQKLMAMEGGGGAKAQAADPLKPDAPVPILAKLTKVPW